MSLIKNPGIKTFLRNVKFLWNTNLTDQHFEDEFYLEEKIMDDMLYEYEENMKLRKTLNILDVQQTLQLISEKPKSFCRFGDGEIAIMRGESQPFQKGDPELANKLLRLIGKKRDDIYIGINSGYFHTPADLENYERKYNRMNSFDFRHFLLEHCDLTNTYIDPLFTCWYLYREDTTVVRQYVEDILNLFKDKDIVLVSGEGVFEKLNFNVFERAKSFKVMHGPSKNSFEQYDTILNNIKNNVSRDQLVCLILGMTSKAMVGDLTDLGYMAWDVGHTAKYYDYYMRKVPHTTENVLDFYAPD